ncbi:MAG TPA: hypothetical protein VFD48_18045 [Pyrinomonadaceae bacterium]|nr:hypothetical protein [Pyrinomonadaceae bacterium]
MVSRLILWIEITLLGLDLAVKKQHPAKIFGGSIHSLSMLPRFFRLNLAGGLKLGKDFSFRENNRTVQDVIFIGIRTILHEQPTEKQKSGNTFPPSYRSQKTELPLWAVSFPLIFSSGVIRTELRGHLSAVDH